MINFNEPSGSRYLIFLFCLPNERFSQMNLISMAISFFADLKVTKPLLHLCTFLLFYLQELLSRYISLFHETPQIKEKFIASRTVFVFLPLEITVGILRVTSQDGLTESIK